MKTRDLEGVHLELVDGAHEVEIRVSVDGWSGVAHFPAPVADEAYREFDKLKTPNDLENLFREWSDEETWGAWQELRNREKF